MSLNWNFNYIERKPRYYQTAQITSSVRPVYSSGIRFKRERWSTGRVVLCLCGLIGLGYLVGYLVG